MTRGEKLKICFTCTATRNGRDHFQFTYFILQPYFIFRQNTYVTYIAKKKQIEIYVLY